MTAKTNTASSMTVQDPNAVPDYTGKAKERRAAEKSTTAASLHTHHRSEILDYAPPCIPGVADKKKTVPKGSVVGHFHSLSLIEAWKQLDVIY
ncbi:hypothetical protein IV203_034343 [Nitzschia inconspicua]|uniref:Uncharacterized protein n=1 Tax=Nitzschia inconspicua TaxID=303405 RepID=A0A9K3Q9P5_9STRA|nr:hypothetical protein IV203_022815 [Nitzschia inconspicua]KAG7373619.1 hypothetical protein IV203_034343 [Nitzschia inconspicua]